jgi:hypothetical protein
MKHLKQMPEKTFENYYKHMQYSDEILAKIRIKHLKTLETYACNMHVYAISTSIFATYR